MESPTHSWHGLLLSLRVAANEISVARYDQSAIISIAIAPCSDVWYRTSAGQVSPCFCYGATWLMTSLFDGLCLPDCVRILVTMTLTRVQSLRVLSHMTEPQLLNSPYRGLGIELKMLRLLQ
jgi:hypothetical protein